MRYAIRTAALAIVAAVAAIAPGHAQGPPAGTVVTGDKPVVIDGDRLQMPGIDAGVRLWAVDAPSERQPCYLQGQPWACGPVATRALEILVEAGPTTCTIVDDPNPRRRRLVWATCEAGGLDLGAEMVKAGMALAFPEQSDVYSVLEDAAEAAGTGIWASAFQLPWEYDQEQLLR